MRTLPSVRRAILIILVPYLVPYRHLRTVVPCRTIHSRSVLRAVPTIHVVFRTLHTPGASPLTLLVSFHSFQLYGLEPKVGLWSSVSEQAGRMLQLAVSSGTRRRSLWHGKALTARGHLCLPCSRLSTYHTPEALLLGLRGQRVGWVYRALQR